MTNEYVVDAHALIWYLVGSSRLGVNARAILHDSVSVLILPVIALAEACWTVERGRTNIPSVAALLTDVDADTRISVVPLERSVLDRAVTLTVIPEIHDRLIVATALLRADQGTPIAVLTRDQSIVASGLVPIVW